MSTKAELRDRIDDLSSLNQQQGNVIRRLRLNAEEFQQQRNEAREEVIKLRLLIRALLPLTGIAEWADKDTGQKTSPGRLSNRFWSANDSEEEGDDD